MFLDDATTLAGLALGTLLSEDLTSIGAGLLVRDGRLGAAEAVASCAAGVYFGDLGLWLAGRVLGQRLLSLPWFERRLDAAALEQLTARIDARLPLMVVGSRFLPGSRLPMFVAAGIGGRRPVAFMAWSLLAVLLWTPLLVLLTAWFGPAVTSPVIGELGYVFRFAVTVAALASLRWLALSLSRRGSLPI
jgi:membrane protein DedA with SNARE-associated domain